MECTYIIKVQHAEHQHWLVLLEKETQGEGPKEPIPHSLFYFRTSRTLMTLDLPLGATKQDEEEWHKEDGSSN